MEENEFDNKPLGLQDTAHEGQSIASVVNGVEYARLPVKTETILIDQDLDQILKKYIYPIKQENDILCIASKIISITKGFYVKESDLKVSWLAKFLVRFIQKHPNDPGFAIPAKVQVAMNEAGAPRFIFAVVVGGALKVLGFKGWFYRLAGHKINAIDGFIPEFYKGPLAGYGFLAPKDSDKICDEIETKHGILNAILDGNNVENHIFGLSRGIKQMYSREEFEEIIKGNPHGQEGNTPFFIVRKK
jgi:hypothetical protein